MGRRELHVIRVPKLLTIALLLVVSAAMVFLVYALSGRAYTSASHPVRDLLVRVLHSDPRPVSRDALLALAMPVIANVLLFIPWGFLAFLALDTPASPRRRTYLLTILGGIVFAAIIDVWQYSLPTRVTSAADAVANTFGATAGAILGHLRKQVRLRFDY
ncbi:MAG: VanZ family protein [Thermoanaerobaculia bacterium]